MTDRPRPPSGAIAATETGIRLTVRLLPNASRNEIGAVLEDADGRAALQVRVIAPAVDGAANAALIGFLAKYLRVRKSDIAIVSGERARRKIVALTGDPVELIGRLGTIDEK